MESYIIQIHNRHVLIDNGQGLLIIDTGSPFSFHKDGYIQLDVAPIEIPDDLPPECDGIIFKNFGKFKITAFYVRNKQRQSMSF